MIQKSPRTTLYVITELVKQKESLGVTALDKLSEGISASFPSEDLTDTPEGLEKLLKKISEFDLKKLFLIKEIPPGNFKPLLPGAITLAANIKSLLDSLDPLLVNEMCLKIIKTFREPFNALNL
jgi:hypothetical protein